MHGNGEELAIEVELEFEARGKEDGFAVARRTYLRPRKARKAPAPKTSRVSDTWFPARGLHVSRVRRDFRVRYY